MILTLTASIMYWSLQQKGGESEPSSPATDGNDDLVPADDMSNLSIEESSSTTDAEPPSQSE